MTKQSTRPGEAGATTERAFALSPLEWPRWPFLPLVHKRRQFAEPNSCALLVADERYDHARRGEDKFRVILDANVWNLEGHISLQEFVDGHDVLDYQTIDNLLADWRID